jgi:hypothetical protein
MRTETVQRSIYTYDELSDSAKDSVRYWVSTFDFDPADYEYQMEQILDEILGSGHSVKVVQWGESSSRTFLEFAGSFHGPSVPETCTIEGAPDPSGVRELEGTFTVDRWGWSYTSDEDGDVTPGAAYLPFIDGIRTVLQSYIDAESEYQSSDEYAAEMCDANGYEFLSDGTPA